MKHFDNATWLYVALAKQNIKESENYTGATDAQNGKAVVKGLTSTELLKTRKFVVELAQKSAHRRLQNFRLLLAEQYLAQGDPAAAIQLARQIISGRKTAANGQHNASTYLLFRTWLLLTNASIAQGDKDEATQALPAADAELSRCNEADFRDSALLDNACSELKYLKGEWELSAVNAHKGLSHIAAIDWSAPSRHPNMDTEMGQQLLTLRLHWQLARAEFKAGHTATAEAVLVRIEKLRGPNCPEKLAAHNLLNIIRGTAVK